MRARVQIVCPGCDFFTDTWVELNRLPAFVDATQRVHEGECFAKEEPHGQKQEGADPGGAQEAPAGGGEGQDSGSGQVH